MIQATAKLICVLAGLYCLLALADRWGWTDPLWAQIWPRTILPRRPSPTEVLAAALEGRMEPAKRQVAEIKDSLSSATERRLDLVRRLRDRLGQGHESDDLARLQAQDPVAFALVRSIDAAEHKQAECQRKLADLEGQLARLEAHLIATRNGLSPTDPEDPVRPSDSLRPGAGDDSAESRYRRIIREARNLN